MDKVIKSYLVRGVVVLALPLMMVGCHRAPNANMNQMGSNQPGCSGNPYLTKYNCSITRIQAAAENGDADAQYALGYMYYYGIDTVKDQQTAALWIKRSAEQGQPLAKKAWSLIDSGSSFSDLHQAAASAAGVSTTAAPGEGDDAPTPNNTIVHQKPEDVTQLNAQTPSEPITKYLPAYRHSTQTGSNKPAVLDTIQNENASSKPQDTTAQNKLTHPAVQITDPRLSSNAKPVVASATAPELSNDFTVQLMASDHLGDVKNFIAEHKLGSQAQYFRTANQGKPWYMLTYGKYASAAQAEKALQTLPHDLKKHEPWVKSLATIEKEVQLKKIIA